VMLTPKEVMEWEHDAKDMQWCVDFASAKDVLKLTATIRSLAFALCEAIHNQGQLNLPEEVSAWVDWALEQDDNPYFEE
jgi:hypothetical protein